MRSRGSAPGARGDEEIRLRSPAREMSRRRYVSDSLELADVESVDVDPSAAVLDESVAAGVLSDVASDESDAPDFLT